MLNIILTGIDFNKKYNNIELIKLTNKNELHNGYQYITGLNIDILDNDLNYTKKGFYFIKKSEMYKWLSYNKQSMKWMRTVSIPDDAKIIINDNYFKCDKFILGNRENIVLDYEMCKTAVKYNGLLLYFMIKHTNEGLPMHLTINSELYMLAIKNNPDVIYYIKDLLYDVKPSKL